MFSSDFDLVTAIGAFVLLPLIIVANTYNRQSGVMGYPWRENAFLARIGLVFLFLTWLGSALQLAAHYHLLSTSIDGALSIGLAIPMLSLAVAVLVMSSMELLKYLRARWST